MLLCQVYERAGVVPHIDPRPYPPDWHLHRSEERFLGWIKQYACRTDRGQPGDVVLFKFGRCISHGGIVMERWPVIVHAWMRAKCVLREDLNFSLGLAQRMHSIWTFR